MRLKIKFDDMQEMIESKFEEIKLTIPGDKIETQIVYFCLIMKELLGFSFEDVVRDLLHMLDEGEFDNIKAEVEKLENLIKETFS